MLQSPTISWIRIAAAVEYYTQHGFQDINVPWVVSKDAVTSTLPEGCRSVESWMGHHVGSAEQSFISLIQAGHITPGMRLQATTPCFRDEPVTDSLHQLHFMKTELFSTHPEDSPYKLATLAARFMRKELFLREELSPCLKIIKTTTDETYDIYLYISSANRLTDTTEDIELGSYGERTVNGVKFVYGTGIAEPRFTLASNIRKDTKA